MIDPVKHKHCQRGYYITISTQKVKVRVSLPFGQWSWRRGRNWNLVQPTGPSQGLRLQPTVACPGSRVWFGHEVHPRSPPAGGDQICSPTAWCSGLGTANPGEPAGAGGEERSPSPKKPFGPVHCAYRTDTGSHNPLLPVLQLQFLMGPGCWAWWGWLGMHGNPRRP